eukprot:TRINITY_DN2575_c0_g1_i3.p1 TRINITY_DN2575_c0_g1~~TRINITY_DN2575_c0_g1_i3.p1  ORF type:complete len:465 (-),score=125.53 TRINITY_DN2575_c0_g1_i3:14-1408(-)
MKLFIAFACFIGVIYAKITYVDVTISSSSNPWDVKPFSFSDNKPVGVNRFAIDHTKEKQNIIGYGVALTQASSSVLQKLPQDQQELVFEKMFGESENNYNFARTHVSSCDFSTQNYAYNEVDGDFELNSWDFSMEDKYIVPMIKKAQEYQKDLKLFASPWSPPAWMKSNNAMDSSLNGCFKSDKHMDTFSKYFSKYLSSYEERNIKFWGITAMNEPTKAHRWDSCWLEPLDYVKYLNSLIPTIKNDHPNVKVMVYDHNRDRLIEYVETIVADKIWSSIDGIAFHWYENDNYTINQIVNEKIDGKLYLNSEGCNCPGVSLNDWSRGVKYAMDIAHDFNVGVMGWVDWNILLDHRGGPNHLNNFCDAPLIVEEGEVHIQPNYYAMRHFSKHLPMNSNIFDVKSPNISAVVVTAGISSQDNKISVIAVNSSLRKQNISLFDENLGKYLNYSLPPNSIVSFRYSIQQN